MEHMETPPVPVIRTLSDYDNTIASRMYGVMETSYGKIKPAEGALLLLGATVNIRQAMPRHTVESDKAERMSYGKKGTIRDIKICRRILKKARREIFHARDRAAHARKVA